jgi:hypothetical protein
MKVRITKEDAVFSKLIRLRDGYTCQKCGKYFDQGHGLQCSHFYSRRHQATRYDPDNACAHCFTCHQRLGENPVEFGNWIRTFLGDARYAELNARHHTIVKRTKRERAALYEHLKSELRRFEKAVSYGITPEPLHVVPFD